jgi:hypothetical protein
MNAKCSGKIWQIAQHFSTSVHCRDEVKPARKQRDYQQYYITNILHYLQYRECLDRVLVSTIIFNTDIDRETAFLWGK